jgi:hypothetical protein
MGTHPIPPHPPHPLHSPHPPKPETTAPTQPNPPNPPLNRAPSMEMEDLQQHTIDTLKALDATHPDTAAAGAPHAHQGPVAGAHDPSGAAAIQDNLKVRFGRVSGCLLPCMPASEGRSSSIACTPRSFVQPDARLLAAIASTLHHEHPHLARSTILYTPPSPLLTLTRRAHVRMRRPLPTV